MTNEQRIALLNSAIVSVTQVRDDLATPGPTPEITATLEANPSAIDAGQSSVLAWATKGADAVMLNGVTVGANGTQTVKPDVTTEYVLVATNVGHQTTRTVTVRVRVPAPGPGGKLVQPGNLSYLYAFPVPADAMWLNGGWALGFNPANGSLLAAGHPKEWLVSEFSIPASGGASKVVQAFADPLKGKRETVDGTKTDGVWLGGLLPVGDQLYVTAFCFYDSEPFQTKCLFKAPLKMSLSGGVTGPVKLGTAGAGMVDGYLTSVPPELQSELGGSAACGQSGIPITRRTSSGPACSIWTPAALGSGMAAAQLLGYPLADPPTLPHGVYNLATYIPGGVIPSGFRSMLFVGAHGDGPLCYGTGAECNDPTDPYKGYHAYPYTKTVWAYAVDDLIAVKAGTKKPSDLRPYAQWPLAVPGVDASRQAIRGVALDPASNRLYVAALGGNGSQPMIHVFEIK